MFDSNFTAGINQIELSCVETYRLNGLKDIVPMPLLEKLDRFIVHDSNVRFWPIGHKPPGNCELEL
jgi:hypothetical protein